MRIEVTDNDACLTSVACIGVATSTAKHITSLTIRMEEDPMVKGTNQFFQ